MAGRAAFGMSRGSASGWNWHGLEEVEKNLRNYQRNTDYKLPQSVYMRVLWKIRDYERLREEQMKILYASSPPPDGQPKSSALGNPTEQKALRRAYIDAELAAIDQASIVLQGEYSNRMTTGFDPLTAFQDYLYFCQEYRRKTKNDEGPCTRTWKYYRARFVYEVAKNSQLI